MNLLITCPGRSVEMTRMFREEFERNGGKVIATGNSNMLPALYEASKSYVVPSIDDQSYIPKLVEICKKESINGILTMLDSDLVVLSKNIYKFEKIGVKSFVASESVVQICNDKFRTYKFLCENGFRTILTYEDINTFIAARNEKKIDFPVFVKPVVGDGSRGTSKVENITKLEELVKYNDNLIIQEFIDGIEFDIDAYIDTISGELVDIFIKRKISTTIGGADKVVSYYDEDIVSLTKKLCKSLDIKGPVNIDLFKVNGEYYISEINPRLGANYICAQELGKNYCKLIMNNMLGKINEVQNFKYQQDIYMMRYDKLISIKEYEIL